MSGTKSGTDSWLHARSASSLPAASRANVGLGGTATAAAFTSTFPLQVLAIGPEKPEVKNLLEDITDYHLSDDGKKLLVRKGDVFYSFDAADKARREIAERDPEGRSFSLGVCMFLGGFLSAINVETRAEFCNAAIGYSLQTEEILDHIIGDKT